MENSHDNPWAERLVTAAHVNDMVDQNLDSGEISRMTLTRPVAPKHRGLMQNDGRAPWQSVSDMAETRRSHQQASGSHDFVLDRSRRFGMEECENFGQESDICSTFIGDQRSDYSPSVADSSSEIEQASVLDPYEDALTAPDTITPGTQRRVTNEQVKRRLHHLLRDAQELRRLLALGTSEWWQGANNTARRQHLRDLAERMQQQVADVRSGETGASDVVLELALESFSGVDHLLRQVLWTNPVSNFRAIFEQTTSAIASVQSLFNGELGSQAMPFRYRTQDGESEDDGLVAVEAQAKGERAELLIEDEEWEVI
jgi:hypothetical protein